MVAMHEPSIGAPDSYRNSLLAPLNRVLSGCLTGASSATSRFNLFSLNRPLCSRRQVREDYILLLCRVFTAKQKHPLTYEAQLVTYFKLSNLNLGFFINWNVTLMKDGIKRIVNNLQ